MLELQQPEFGVNFSELSFFIKPEMKLVPSIDLAGGGGGGAGIRVIRVRVNRVKMAEKWGAALYLYTKTRFRRPTFHERNLIH